MDTSSKADQMHPNATACPRVKGSFHRNTASRKVMLGAMYCMNPSVTRVRRWAAILNQIRGNTVSRPASSNITSSHAGPARKSMAPLRASQPRKTTAGPKTSVYSHNSPTMARTPRRLRTRP